MTKVKLCGLTRRLDIEIANELTPDFIGFVFAPKSKRYITPHDAAALKNILHESISAVGVFVNEKLETVAEISKFLDAIQLHGAEDEDYISALRRLTKKPLIKAFKIQTAADLKPAEICSADYVLLDGGAGDGKVFDWQLLKNFQRPYFLAGGLNAENVQDAVKILKPYAVDVSSSIETDGVKDAAKMKNFVRRVREVKLND